MWHAYQASYFASNVRVGIMPDENEHINSIVTFLKYGDVFFVKDHPETFSSGPISRYSFLYTTFMAYVAKLNIFDVPLRLYLRMANVCLSVIGLFISWRLVRELGAGRLLAVATLAIQTNVLMYPFISGSVNYDNLAYLFSFGGWWALLRHSKTNSVASACAQFLCILIGSLVKFTILAWLPFFCFALVSIHWRKIRGWRRIFPLLGSFLKSRQGALLSALLLIAIGLNANLYLLNVVRFGQVVVLECEPDMDLEMCRQSATMDRPFAFLRLRNAESERIKLVRYVPLYFQHSVDRVFGIFGHREVRMPQGAPLFGASVAFGVCLFGLAGFYRNRPIPKPYLLATSGICFYVMMIFLQNYSFYLKYGQFGMALQGRYWFPALPLMAALLATGYIRVWPIRLRPFMVLVLFLCGTSFSYGHFQRRASVDVFISPSSVRVPIVIKP